MKNIIVCCIAFAASALLSSCEKSVINEEYSGNSTETVTKLKNFTFSLKGDFQSPTFTRTSTTVQESSMTDLWLLDYVDGTMVQQKHISNTDAEWSSPKISLVYGVHHVYIVASAGSSPTLSATDGTIVWTKPGDTFYKDYQVNVTSTSNGNRSVTLDRIATSFRVKITDEVPESISKIELTPSVWYYGFNYVTGEGCNSSNAAISISVPASYAGTTGKMNLSFYGIGTAAEYNTDVSVNATNSNGTSIGSATITSAPMQRNRVTEYSGSLFHSSGEFSMSINTDWNDPYTGNF